MSDYLIVIPARRGAKRLPDKPLRLLAGRPLIAHVVAQAKRCQGARVVLATDDPAVAAAAGEVEWVLTDPHLQTGSDRVAMAVRALDVSPETVVVNLQGDEPFAPPEAPHALVRLLLDSGCPVATLACPVVEARELFDPNCVKVVLDRRGRALYFSRAPIPWARDHFPHDQLSLPAEGRWLRHIGIYAYRAEFLARFAAEPPLRWSGSKPSSSCASSRRARTSPSAYGPPPGRRAWIPKPISLAPRRSSTRHAVSRAKSVVRLFARLLQSEMRARCPVPRC